MLIVGSTFASDGLFSTFLQEVKDVDNFGYGLINGLFVSFEAITLFILTKRKKHVHTGYMLLAAAIMHVVRMFVNYLEPHLHISILFSILRGVEYVLVLYPACMYVVHLVGKDKSTKGIMLMVLFQLIFTTISGNIFDRIIENYGYQTYHLVNTILGGVMVLFWLFRLKFIKKKIPPVKEM